MKRFNNYKYSYFQKQRTSNQTQELRYNISKKDKAIAKWLSLKDQELGSDTIYKDTQTHLNMKEVLILAEYDTMNYSTLELQEALNNNTSKNAAIKRKRDPESPQKDTNKLFLALTETIIQNSKCFKKDSTDEQSISRTKQEDIYSSQWVLTRNAAEASQKPILAPKTKEKRPQLDLRSSSKECPRSNKSVNLDSKTKYTGKENISQTNLLQEILKCLNHLEISQKESKHLAYNNHNNINNTPGYQDSTFKIVCHNLNSLKQNNQKLWTLMEWAKEDRINILGLAETNINSK
ncbi:12500_t:CDS:2, partial [Gigaspora margarita]